MLLDAYLKCSVEYKILLLKGNFLAFLTQIWSKLVKNTIYSQDYFYTQFEELSMILYWKIQKLLPNQSFYTNTWCFYFNLYSVPKVARKNGLT